MAIGASKTWVAGEVLTASELNAEFLNVYNNGESLGWPATVSKDMAGNVLILDSDGDTTITSDTDDLIDFSLSGVDLFIMDGTVPTPVNGLTATFSAAGTAVSLDAHGSDTNISINLVPKGSGAVQFNGEELKVKEDFIVALQEYA